MGDRLHWHCRKLQFESFIRTTKKWASYMLGSASYPTEETRTLGTYVVDTVLYIEVGTVLSLAVLYSWILLHGSFGMFIYSLLAKDCMLKNIGGRAIPLETAMALSRTEQHCGSKLWSCCSRMDHRENNFPCFICALNTHISLSEHILWHGQ